MSKPCKYGKLKSPSKGRRCKKRRTSSKRRTRSSRRRSSGRTVGLLGVLGVVAAGAIGYTVWSSQSAAAPLEFYR